MDDKNKKHVKKAYVVEVGSGAPLMPQLVPVTIRWVDADRAYRVQGSITIGTVGTTLFLGAFQLPARFILIAVVAGSVAQVILRAYYRHMARRDLDEMRARLG